MSYNYSFLLLFIFQTLLLKYSHIRNLHGEGVVVFGVPQAPRGGERCGSRSGAVESQSTVGFLSPVIRDAGINPIEICQSKC